MVMLMLTTLVVIDTACWYSPITWLWKSMVTILLLSSSVAVCWWSFSPLVVALLLSIYFGRSVECGVMWRREVVVGRGTVTIRTIHSCCGNKIMMECDRWTDQLYLVVHKFSNDVMITTTMWWSQQRRRSCYSAVIKGEFISSSVLLRWCLCLVLSWPVSRSREIEQQQSTEESRCYINWPCTEECRCIINWPCTEECRCIINWPIAEDKPAINKTARDLTS